MRNWVIALTAALLLVPATRSVADEVCVRNEDRETLLFVAEARGGNRMVAQLSTGEVLCATSTKERGGVVSVFESLDELEGCSRIVSTLGGTRVLHRYVSFDRCEWDDNKD